MNHYATNNNKPLCNKPICNNYATTTTQSPANFKTIQNNMQISILQPQLLTIKDLFNTLWNTRQWTYKADTLPGHLFWKISDLPDSNHTTNNFVLDSQLATDLLDGINLNYYVNGKPLPSSLDQTSPQPQVAAHLMTGFKPKRQRKQCVYTDGRIQNKMTMKLEQAT